MRSIKINGRPGSIFIKIYYLNTVVYNLPAQTRAKKMGLLGTKPILADNKTSNHGYKAR